MEMFTGVNAFIFLGIVLAIGAALEAMAPWRRSYADYVGRWLRGASLIIYTYIFLNLIPVLSGYVIAGFAAERGFGLLNLFEAPLWLAVILSVVVLDFMEWACHRALHHWPVLWRAHRTHHTDTHVDVATSLRFHPFENLFRAVAEAPVILALGLPFEGILASFVIVVIVNTYTHMNIQLPMAVERVFGWVFVPPRVHRLHHTTLTETRDVNFGTIFSLWDRLSGAYIGPEGLKEDAVYGLTPPEAPERDTFATLALDPFRTVAHSPDERDPANVPS